MTRPEPRRLAAGALGGLVLAATVFAFTATLPVAYRAEATVDVRNEATPDLLPTASMLLAPRSSTTAVQGGPSYVPPGAAQRREIARLASAESGIGQTHLLRIVRVADSKNAPPSFDQADMANRRLSIIATSSDKREVARAANVFAANLVSYRRRQYAQAIGSISNQLSLRAKTARRQRRPALAAAFLSRLDRSKALAALESNRLALTVPARSPGGPESPRPWRDAAVAFGLGFLAGFFAFPVVRAARLRRRAAVTAATDAPSSPA